MACEERVADPAASVTTAVLMQFLKGCQPTALPPAVCLPAALPTCCVSRPAQFIDK